MSALLLLLGCPWFGDAQRAAVLDADGDGITALAFGGEDCDDSDPDVGAAALEVYADADGDGLGGAASSTILCEVDAGHVADSTDCDDADPAVGAPGPMGRDADADGYAADGAEATALCPGTDGYASEAGDCDDADATLHPGAVESCLGGVDTNCDGTVGGDFCTTAGLSPLITNTTGGLGDETDFALHLLGRVDVDGDGALDVLVAAPYGYAFFAWSGVDLLAGRDLALPDALLRFDEEHFQTGLALTLGDATGDGIADLLVGCPGHDDEERDNSAEVLVVALPTSGHVSRSDGIVRGGDRVGWFGYSIAWNDDLDGSSAMLVGAPVENEGKGAAWVVPLPLPGQESYPIAELDAGSASGLPSEPDVYGLGWDVAWLQAETGDIAVIADQAASVGSEFSGAVALWPAHFGDDTQLSASEGAGLYCTRGYEGFGYSISVGDLDGDDVEDLAVGAIGAEGQATGSGIVYVYRSAATLEGWHDESVADVVFLGDDHNGGRGHNQGALGAKLAFAGDMNHDGLLDLAMAAPLEDGLADEPYAGAVYVAPGGIADGEYDVEAVSWSRHGDVQDLRAGATLAPAGDIDGDERDDLLVGLPGWEDAEGFPVGAVTIWWGSQL